MNLPQIYIGTGGYADTDLIGTLYPFGTKEDDFLAVYSLHYDKLEINSTFYASLGVKAFEGVVEKAEGRLCFSSNCIKISATTTPQLRKMSATFWQPCNRRYLNELIKWFNNTTKSQAFYNIETLKGFLAEKGVCIKPIAEFLSGQQSLF